MKGRILTLARWAAVIICLAAYGLVWGIWGIGGLQLLEDLTLAMPPLVALAFVSSSVTVMLIGLIGFWRDLLGFIGLRPRND